MTFDTGVRVGKYEIGQKLGQGGFGILYVARDTELDRDVAIKFLRPEHVFKQQVVQRFLQEARAAARINHPGIVTVYESGEVSGTNTRADGTVYIAMELLAGDTLSQRIKQAGRLPYGIAIGICRQMAAALVEAHSAGIVHRDLKPQNIFLVRDPAVVGGERVKVLDFGIAKLADGFASGVQTHSLVMLGTPMYMSPEQCKSSAKVDARSDVYALGCILFEMLCGRTPFDGDSGELIAKHQLVAPPTARSVLPELPEELDALVAAMLSKSPDERPQTMSAVLDVLDAIEERIAPAPEVSGERPLPRDDFANRTTIASGGASGARSRLDKLKGKGGVAAIAALAIGLGICGGVVAMRDDKPRTATAATGNEKARDPEVAIAEPPTTTPTDNAAPAPAPSPTVTDVDQLVIECRRYIADAKWTECVSCADRVTALDETRGLQLGALCKDPSESSEPPAIAPHAEAQPRPATTKSAKPTKTAGACDAEAAKEKAMQAINMGQHAAALANLEASLRCNEDSYVIQLAFMESCASANSSKAKLYYTKLTPRQQAKFAPICDRQEPPVAYKAPCDAEKLKEKGMSNINMGQHAAAFASFEASVKCKDDPYVRQLTFMEACASGNSKMAKQYYKTLTPAQQTKFAQICIRQKPPVPYQ